ncbi:hydroxymyristoyl-ACP dehydratase [Flavobacteriaceae bacterium R38]|nr:hydroxymyristoyl-ACP dehydratase [Flavobacteriaceae bacterium R38]
MEVKDIIAQLPYTPPFLFVDELIEVTANGAKGCFTFDESLDFYKGHFKDHPVTPGVILTETMAQIGVVCLGIFLMSDSDMNASVAFTSSNVEFLKPVYPNEKVTVISEKIYFRFGKLKCKVRMLNQKEEVVCTGEIAGMLINPLGNE